MLFSNSSYMIAVAPKPWWLGNKPIPLMSTHLVFLNALIKWNQPKGNIFPFDFWIPSDILWYENKTHALIKVKDDLVLKDLNLLAEELVKEKTDKVHKFAENNKEQICTTIELEKYNEIVDLLFNYLILKEPREQYRIQVKNIKDMIITSKTRLTKYVDNS